MKSPFGTDLIRFETSKFTNLHDLINVVNSEKDLEDKISKYQLSGNTVNKGSIIRSETFIDELDDLIFPDEVKVFRPKNRLVRIIIHMEINSNWNPKIQSFEGEIFVNQGNNSLVAIFLRKLLRRERRGKFLGIYFVTE